MLSENIWFEGSLRSDDIVTDRSQEKFAVIGGRRVEIEGSTRGPRGPKKNKIKLKPLHCNFVTQGPPSGYSISEW